MQRLLCAFAGFGLASSHASAHEETAPTAGGVKVTRLFAHELPGHPGEEVSIVLVEIPPGASSPAHRHPGPVFVYGVQGAVEMQVKDGPLTTLHAGEVFFEDIGAVHAVSKNASTTEPAKIIAFMIAKAGAPIVLPS